MSHKNRNAATAGKPKRVAIVISNPGVSTTTGWPVGFWWAELSHPYFKFTEAGYQVEVFSPQGGACQADAMSDPDDPSEWQAEDVSERTLEHAAGRVAAAAIAAIELSKGRPPILRPGAHCDWCPRRSGCSAGRGPGALHGGNCVALSGPAKGSPPSTERIARPRAR